jgi:ubiquinone biosynthesis protein
VQVFELGLFHADPHAGNLMLTESGSVGLYDWGLSGELMEADRRHIAAILKAVIALDLEQLVDALIVMGEEVGKVVEREAVKKELKAVIALIKKGREKPDQKPSLQALFEACLKGAERLGIPVPDGLLMMAKSLITIEGLARGIDPKVSLGRIATPVLLRAARPGITDLFAMGKSLPRIARQMFGK